VVCGLFASIWIAGGSVPFQVVDSAGITGHAALREDFTLRGRAEYSRVHMPGAVNRAYYLFGGGAEYKVHPHIILDASLAYRWGVTPGTSGAGDFNDFILSLGAAVLF